MSDNKAGLYAKMAAVMAEMSNIPKTGRNAHFDYRFVTADAVADKVRELLAAKGIAFFAAIVDKNLMEIRRTYTDKKTGEMQTASGNRWVVDFEFTFADGETGMSQTSQWSAEADAADDKGINKCATAAEKYFLLKTFIVSSADEPDADADGGRKRPQATQNGKQAQRPPQSQQTQNGMQNPSPNGVPSSTPASSQTAGVSVSAKDDLFPPPIEGATVMPLNTDGDSEHLPRDVNGMPILGSLDMKALGKLTQEEGLVRGQRHFANLIDVLWKDGSIRAASKPEAVMEAIRQHYATKDLQREAVGK